MMIIGENMAMYMFIQNEDATIPRIAQNPAHRAVKEILSVRKSIYWPLPNNENRLNDCAMRAWFCIANEV